MTKPAEQLSNNLFNSPKLTQLGWPYFDPSWYHKHDPKLEQSSQILMAHYLSEGWLRNWDPSPYFDVSWYTRTYGQALNGQEPLGHFLTQGWKAGCNPNALFDVNDYLQNYPDVLLSRIEPLFHYVLHGSKEGRSPGPYFDSNWYLKNNADIAEAGIEPLLHYRLYGWAEGRSPIPAFDSKWYLHANPDVARAAIDPVFHYVAYGWREGRNPNEFFDVRWYLDHNSDVKAAGVEPLLHYIRHGWKEMRDPSPNFSTRFYTAYDSDASRYGLDPLSHFLTVGRHAGRKPTLSPYKKRLPALDAWKEVNRPTSARISALRRATGNTSYDSKTLTQSAIRDFVGQCVTSTLVSFDVFDTLIERSCGAPEIVFDLMSSNSVKLPVGMSFREARVKAELEARQRAGIREITHSEIYDALSIMFDVSREEAERLQKQEEELEIQVAVPKPIGVELARLATKLGKKVIYVSDIYLSKNVVHNILKKCGISIVDGLYISSELFATKHYGEMFDIILEDHKMPAHKILHVGDNKHSDFEMPRSRQIRSLRIRKTFEFAENFSRLDAATAADANHAWNSAVSSLILRKRLKVDSQRDSNPILAAAYDVGYNCLGSSLLGFAQFVADTARRAGYNKLFFISRDGFYLKEAYDCLRKRDTSLPESHYLLASRAACRLAALVTQSDVEQLAGVDHFPTSIIELLQSRFQLSEQAIMQALPRKIRTEKILRKLVTKAVDDPHFTKILSCLQPLILEHAEAARERYIGYLESAGISDADSAVVDIGYRGTTQRIIASLLNKSLGGIYYIAWPEIRNLLRQRLRYDVYINSTGKRDDPLVKYVQLVELFFSANHGSLTGFERNGANIVPILRPSGMPGATIEFVNSLHEGAVDFVEDFFQQAPKLLHKKAPTGRQAVERLVAFLRDPTPMFVSGLSNLNFEDAFGGESRPLVDGNTSRGERLETKPRAECIWPEGTTALLNLPKEERPNRGRVKVARLDHFSGTASTPAFRRASKS